MSVAEITITYELKPPAQTAAEELKTSKTQSFSINSSPADSQEKYYKTLQKVVTEARNAVGDDLTAWRNAVGKAELSKETPKTLKYEEGDEGEDDEE